MRAVAIVVCLMLVVGCGERDSGRGAAHEAPDACDSALQDKESRQLASIAPVSRETRTHATSWVGFEDLYELAWASHLIVRGRVTADCGTDANDDDMRTIPDFSKRMLVSIDAVYRGTPRDTILIPATSDGYSSDAAMTFTIGDEVILFLDADGFLVGGPQGHWRMIDGRTVPHAGHFPALPLDTFARSLAAALHQNPPDALHYRFPSLDVAPTGPALPVDRESPLACNGTVPPPGEHVEAASDRVWVSERIVIGTVREVRPSFVPDDPILDVERSLRVPATDYVVQVERHLRGTQIETLTLRQLGGTVDGCAVDVFGASDLAVGDRLLLFLTPLDAGHTTYVTSAGQRGLWRIGYDGTLASNAAWQSYPQVVPTADLAGLVASALAGEMPDDQWMEHDPVALETSPLGDTNWPQPTIPDDWVTYDDPNGRFALKYPAGWTPLAATEEALVVLASWPATTTDEPIPTGEVRIEIRQLPANRWFDDPTSVPVAAADQFAWLYFDASHWPLDPAPPGQVHRIVANYQQAGSAWEVHAAFGSQPAPDDPATLAFYRLLRSIQHPAT